ncbi:Transcriptional adapter 1 [Branchiostoma belcheri]|nr:Transcriptional adapter 1 [Branchiostoma belcheri]
MKSCNSTKETTSVRNESQVIEPRMNTTGDLVDLLTPYNTSHVAPNIFSSFPVSVQTTSVDQSTFSTVSMGDTLEEEQDMIMPIVAAVSGTVFMIAVLPLSLWGRRRRLQHQRAQALQQIQQARHSLLDNQMYGINSNEQQLDNRAAVPHKVGCAGIQPYVQVPLSKIEESTSQDCNTNHTYTYIKDDVHSARQLVEANQHGDEQGRYETIPNELGCTGVEPYAEIPLSNIAVEPVMAEVECHARDKAAVTDDEMTDVSEEGGSAVQSTSNETVYRNVVDSQESTSSDFALLSKKKRQDRKNTVNETVYQNAADSQESTSSEAVLLSGQNRQETISCTATSVSAKDPTILSCDYCQLVQLPTIDDENITKLSLIWNNITDISNIPYLPKVVTIDMNHNLITALRWPWLTNAPCLEHLDLSYNRIVRVSGRFESHLLPNVTYINLMYNRISSFPKESFLFLTVEFGILDIIQNPFRCDKDLCWLLNELQCLSGCIRCASKVFPLVIPVFRECCPKCPASNLYCSLLGSAGGLTCASPSHVVDHLLRDVLIESCNSTEDTASVRNRGQVIEPRVNMTADITVRLTPSNTSRVAPNAFSPLSVRTTQMTPVYQSTFSTVSMSNALEEEQDIIKPIVASVSGTVFMTAVLALSLWGRRRRLQHQRAQALQQVLQARHSLLHNQMYGMNSNQQRLDNRAAVPSQAGCAEIQLYAEVPLSKIEESTSQDCDTNHTYTYIKDDVHSARQLVEANQHGDEQGRYETIPNELGCTGVEPYAEIPLSNIAVEPMMAEVECHDARDEGKDTNIKTSSLQPSVSDSRLVIEERETSQTPGLLDISHGVCQMETVPKGTHVSVATVTDDEMTDVAEEDDSAVQSTSNETVYRNVVDSQESTSSDFALLSKKNRQDRKNTVNETVYRNAADSQESTSREAVLLSGQNHQENCQSTEQLRRRLRVHNIKDTVRYNRLRWYGHLQRMDRDRWPKRILTLDVEGPNPRGRPRRKWYDNVREDLHHLNLDKIDPQDRDKWRAAIKPQMYCASTSNPRKTGNNRR